MPMISIQLNGEPRDVPDGCTIAKLLELLEVRTRGVAVEVNREVHPRSTHAEVTLAAGDTVEVVTLVGGG